MTRHADEYGGRFCATIWLGLGHDSHALSSIRTSRVARRLGTGAPRCTGRRSARSLARNRSGAQHRSPRNPCTFERSHRRERRQSCFAALTARHLHRAGPASSRFERASSCPSRPSSPQRIFRFEPPPALTARAASAGQSKRLLRMLLVRCRRASPMWPLGAEPPRSEQGSTIPFPATRFPKSDGGR